MKNQEEYRAHYRRPGDLAIRSGGLPFTAPGARKHDEPQVHSHGTPAVRQERRQLAGQPSPAFRRKEDLLPECLAGPRRLWPHKVQ